MPVAKVDEYRDRLRDLADWEPYLLDESRLPGPRANLELVEAVADLGTRRRFEQLLAWTADRGPTGSKEEFLALCGTVGLGRLVAEGEARLLPRLRSLASDPRWRIREGVAMALQRVGAVDMKALLTEMRQWARGSDYERRAAAAALCEPRLLGHPSDAQAVLAILDRITRDMTRSTNRHSDGFRALRKALAYCWSVAVAAAPEAGRPLMEKWMGSEDRDVRWLMKQNLAKNRLAAAGRDWVERWRKQPS